jgi:hypothetical protein
VYQNEAIPETDPKKENEHEKQSPSAEAYIGPELEEIIQKIFFERLEK